MHDDLLLEAHKLLRFQQCTRKPKSELGRAAAANVAMVMCIPRVLRKAALAIACERERAKLVPRSSLLD